MGALETTDRAALDMEDLLQFLYLAPVGIVKFTSLGAIDLMNPCASAMLSQIAPGTKLTDLYEALADVVPELRTAVGAFSQTAGLVLESRRLDCSSGGRELIVSLVVTRVSSQTYMAVITDLTLTDQRERAVFAERKKLRIIIDSLHDYAIYTLSPDGKIQDWSPNLQQHTGWPEEEARGASFDILFDDDDDPARPCREHLLEETRRVGSVEIEGWQVRRDGGRTWTNTIISALPDVSGQLNGFAVVSRDMSERKRLEDDMKALASTDALTGAYNRRQGATMLRREVDRRARDGHPLALLMLDIDWFKATNDRYGHAGGDAVLSTLVGAAKSVLRSVDTLARWGGEEFIVILPNTDQAAALVTAERLRRTLAGAQTKLACGDVISFTVSIGVAADTDADGDELLRRADVALYAAKAQGRNRVALGA